MASATVKGPLLGGQSLVDTPKFDPDLVAEIENMMEFVDIVAQIQELVDQGYTDIFIRNPSTGVCRRVWVLSAEDFSSGLSKSV
jgi:hypothetical protein